MATLTSTPSGSYFGGDTFSLSGSGLTVAALQDTFSDGVIGGLWSTAVAGTGVITEVTGSPLGVMQLDSGVTAASSARLRSADTPSKFDAEFKVSISLLDAPTSTQKFRITLGKYTSATTYLRFILDMNRDGQFTIERITQAGGPIQILPLSTGVLIQGSVAVLRILSIGTSTFFFMNGQKMDTAIWTSAGSNVEIGVENAAATASRIVTTVSQFTRRPVILFGTLPVETLTYVKPLRVEGTVPAANKDGFVDIVMTDSVGTTTLTNGFEYTADANPILLGQTNNSSLMTFNDATIRSVA